MFTLYGVIGLILLRLNLFWGDALLPLLILLHTGRCCLNISNIPQEGKILSLPERRHQNTMLANSNNSWM